MLGNLKDNKGFTFVELLMVFIVLGILAQMAWTFMIDLRTRSYDVTAVADGKNLITMVRNNFVNLDDADYTKINGSDVGVETTGGSARPPVFTLSPGVRAVITGGSESTGIPDTSFFEAYMYHENGTDDPASITGCGKREFYYLADETTDPPSYSIATY
jgi:prepilin-type N-terminal cleavage/methylation domain-containing protein